MALKLRVKIKRYFYNLKVLQRSPLINKIEKITKQGCRVYSSVEEIPKTIGGLGTTILSTSKGVMSDADARTQKVGGEVLISVF
jgi:small subunit ribosomal protein S8